MNKHPFVIAVVGGGLLVLALLARDISKQGERPVTPLTTIRGVAYPMQATNTVVSESLAHADIQLQEPVLAKEVEIRIEFIPHQTHSLALGVRRDSFWLSYEPAVFYQNEASSNTIASAIVTIPLTDAFQDSDRSIDMLVFADTSPADLLSGPSAVLEDPAADTADWELISLTAQVKPSRPDMAALKNYVRSLVYRERSL